MLLFPGHKRVVPLRHLFSHAGVAQHLVQVTHGEQFSPLVDSFRRICLRVKHGRDRKASHSFVLPTSGRTYVVSPGNRALLGSYPLGRNWVAVIFIDLAPKLGLQQNVRIELRGPLHLLPALLDSHEAFAHSKASIGIRKWWSWKPKCPPTVTCKKRTFQSASSIRRSLT